MLVPIRLRSEANVHEHWTKKHKKKKKQQQDIAYFWNLHCRDVHPPVVITLLRLAPRKLDEDNLVAAFKWIRDQIADMLFPGLAPGRADDQKGITFLYGQEISKTYAVKILILLADES